MFFDDATHSLFIGISNWKQCWQYILIYHTFQNRTRQYFLLICTHGPNDFLYTRTHAWSADFVQDSFSKDLAYSISLVSLFIDIIVLKYGDRSCFQSPRTWSPSARTRARRSPRFCWSPSLWKICTIVKFFMSQFEINQPTNTTHTCHEFPNNKDFQTIKKILKITI